VLKKKPRPKPGQFLQWRVLLQRRSAVLVLAALTATLLAALARILLLLATATLALSAAALLTAALTGLLILLTAALTGLLILLIVLSALAALLAALVWICHSRFPSVEGFAIINNSFTSWFPGFRSGTTRLLRRGKPAGRSR